MTIEKSILAKLTSDRIVGVTSESEAITFANGVARKRNRPALPNDFVRALDPIRRRIVSKHDNNSPEGKFLASIKEIRIRPSALWAAVTLPVEMLFVYARLGDIPPDVDLYIPALLARFGSSGIYPPLTGRAVSLETLPAATFLRVTSSTLSTSHLRVPKQGFRNRRRLANLFIRPTCSPCADATPATCLLTLLPDYSGR